MNKVELGCFGLVVLLGVVPAVQIGLDIHDMKSIPKALAQQFNVGTPLIPFSLKQSSGDTLAFFSREGQKEVDCLRISARNDEVTFWIDKQQYDIKLDDFPQKLVNLRDHLIPCDTLSVHYKARGISERTRFDVHYDASLNVTKIDLPF